MVFDAAPGDLVQAPGDGPVDAQAFRHFAGRDAHVEQARSEYACGEIRAGRCRMAAIRVVERDIGVTRAHLMPRDADRDDAGADLAGDRLDRIREVALRTGNARA